MKTLSAFVAAVSVFQHFTCFAAPPSEVYTFTAVSVDSLGEVFAGVKKVKAAMAVSSGLVEINPKTMKSVTLKLPAKIQDRELRVILSDQEHVFVVSQWVVERGDNPLLHVYDRKTKKWSEIGQVDCPGIVSVSPKPAGLEFTCQETNVKDGKDMIVLKLLASPQLRLPGAGTFEIPQVEASAGESTAALDGDPFSAAGLRVKTHGKEKILLAKNIRF